MVLDWPAKEHAAGNRENDLKLVHFTGVTAHLTARKEAGLKQDKPGETAGQSAVRDQGGESDTEGEEVDIEEDEEEEEEERGVGRQALPFLVVKVAERTSKEFFVPQKG